MAAFQQLGPFISTFADPDLTGLYVNEEGILCFRHPENIQNMLVILYTEYGQNVIY